MKLLAYHLNFTLIPTVSENNFTTSHDGNGKEVSTEAYTNTSTEKFTVPRQATVRSIQTNGKCR